MKKQIQKAIANIASKIGKDVNSTEALHYTQGILNAMNALCTLSNIEIDKARREKEK